MSVTSLLLIAAASLAAAAILGIGFRRGMLALAPERHKSILRHMPATASFGILVIVVYAAVGLLAPVLAPYAERAVVGTAYMPWSEAHPLGTDNLGRDMLSRLIYGARNTVGIALVTTMLAFLIGTALGLWAATMGGWIDNMLSRAVDVLMAIPSLIFALLCLTVLGTSILNLIIVIALIDATRVYRLSRAVAQTVVAMEYIEAARVRGEGMWRLITREVLPNATAPLVAEAGLRFCFVFLNISALSFLGLGIQPPTADWGSMVRENASLITFGDITPLLPAGAIALLTVSVNFVVDWMLHRSSGLKS